MSQIAKKKKELVRPEIMAMADLITPMGFRRLNASSVMFDNEKCSLTIGMSIDSKANFDGIIYSKNQADDNYKLEFKKFVGDTAEIEKHTVHENVKAEDVKKLIEKESGLDLTKEVYREW